jgi:hypothetical protein
MKILFFGMGIIFLLSGTALAQSTAEYGALTTGVTAAAAKAQKGNAQGQAQGSQDFSTESPGFVEGAMAKLYGDSVATMSTRGAALIGQAGSPGTWIRETADAVSTSSNASAVTTVATPVSTQASSSTSGSSVPLVTLRLKSGQVVKGELVEKTKDYVKVDAAGVGVTYFNDEIERVE